MSEWYVIDERTNTIVNCVTTSGTGAPTNALRGFIDAEHLRLDPNPPLAMLQKYRYWNERP